MSVKCQETLTPVHVELTSRWYSAWGGIAPGIPHQQEALAMVPGGGLYDMHVVPGGGLWCRAGACGAGRRPVVPAGGLWCRPGACAGHQLILQPRWPRVPVFQEYGGVFVDFFKKITRS